MKCYKVINFNLPWTQYFISLFNFFISALIFKVYSKQIYIKDAVKFPILQHIYKIANFKIKMSSKNLI